MVVHFMQPHFPAVNYSELGSELAIDNDVGWPDSIWNRLEDGSVSEETVQKAYRDNLVYVLDYVKTLLNNVDAPRTVITADHGNAFGERGLYGHPANYCTEELRRVPWCETEAHDSGEYTPQRNWDNTDVGREDQLRALGYV